VLVNYCNLCDSFFSAGRSLGLIQSKQPLHFLPFSVYSKRKAAVNCDQESVAEKYLNGQEPLRKKRGRRKSNAELISKKKRTYDEKKVFQIRLLSSNLRRNFLFMTTVAWFVKKSLPFSQMNRSLFGKSILLKAVRPINWFRSVKKGWNGGRKQDVCVRAYRFLEKYRLLKGEEKS
jgi:hypothetical protein